MIDHFIAMITKIVGHRNVRKTSVLTVVAIRGGWFSALFRKLESRKSSLLAELRQRHAYAYLWLDDWNDDLIKEIKSGGWDAARENLFRVPQNQNIQTLYVKLYQGKWQLFFSDQLLEPNHEQVLFAKEPGDVERLLVRGEAQVVIVSWFDDAEWLVGWQPFTGNASSVSPSDTSSMPRHK